MDTIDLNGTWQLAWSDDIRGHAGHLERDNVEGCSCIDAQVPGEVHLDLERAGLIGDVRLGLNALQARWVEETRWTYRREFVAPPEAVRAHAWLVSDDRILTGAAGREQYAVVGIYSTTSAITAG